MSSVAAPPADRKYEPHVNTADFLDADGEYTPVPAKSLPLPPERQKIVDTVIGMYNGRIKELAKDMERCYHEQSTYDDIMSFSNTRRKIAAQFIALPNVFSKVEVLEHEVARNDPDLICVKMHMAYTAPIMGTKTIKNLLSLALDTTGPTPVIRYHKDQWNEKDYSHTGIGALFKKLNGEAVPKLVNIPDNL